MDNIIKITTFEKAKYFIHLLDAKQIDRIQVNSCIYFSKYKSKYAAYDINRKSSNGSGKARPIFVTASKLKLQRYMISESSIS